VKPFKAPERSLRDLDARAAAALIAAVADVALIVDGKGVIRDVAFGNEDLPAELGEVSKWTGRPWADTVTSESRPKVESLLHDATLKSPPRWRQVNHPSPRGEDIPIVYSAVTMGRAGFVVAVGRDLRAVSALQQRLVQAQQSMERDYWRLRQAETRYRLLFSTASEAVLIVDAATQKVLEANPAADALLGTGAKPIVGRVFPDGFDKKGTQATQSLLAAVRSGGRAEDVRVRMMDSKREHMVSATYLRQEGSALFLVRIAPADTAFPAAGLARSQAELLKVLENGPDALAVTDTQGRIVTANRAFVDLVQLPTEEQVRGESLDRWLGRPGVDLGVLTANLRQHGSVRLFATGLRGEFGTLAEVEISAVSVLHGEQSYYGFVIRNIAPRLAADARTGNALPKSVEQLTELVGRVSLRELVREATDVIERLCIEAALELTDDNRASAAEMLGLSRQSLYVKLRRYGLGDLAHDTEG